MEDLFGISKSSVKIIVKEVSFLISNRLRNQYIVMPSTNDEILRAKVDFMRWSNFPLCIGAVDGTHVDVRSFGGDDAELYRDRHMRFSLNVQLTVSADVCGNFRKLCRIYFNSSHFVDRNEFWMLCLVGQDLRTMLQFLSIQIYVNCSAVAHLA